MMTGSLNKIADSYWRRKNSALALWSCIFTIILNSAQANSQYPMYGPQYPYTFPMDHRINPYPVMNCPPTKCPRPKCNRPKFDFMISDLNSFPNFTVPLNFFPNWHCQKLNREATDTIPPLGPSDRETTDPQSTTGYANCFIVTPNYKGIDKPFRAVTRLYHRPKYGFERVTASVKDISGSP
eukprot:Sdes_comp15255_c0_seq1m4094